MSHSKRAPYTLLIDGPSSAGKTTLAEQIGRALAIEVVHLDDFYPGWSGLAAGARMVADSVLDPARPGYQRWDWELGRPAEWVPLDPAADLIVEGVGAVTAASVARARARGSANTIRVVGEPAVRKARALERDPGYAEWWDMWAAQEALLPRLDVDVEVRRA